MSAKQRTDTMSKLTVRAQNNLFSVSKVEIRKEYLDSLGGASAVKKFRDSIRDYAVEGFWDNERELIKEGKATYNWTPDQQRQILNIVDVAKEQYGFCNDTVDQGTGTIKSLAETLVDSKIWYFWWD